jgi:uncharacterized protein (TIGR02996 family)
VCDVVGSAVTEEDKSVTDGEALLAAIRLHPDEDVPRLAYADWLTENGQPERGEFIRVQCELSRMKPGPKEDQKAANLLARYRKGAPIPLRANTPAVLMVRSQLLLDRLVDAGLPIDIGSNQITCESGFILKVEVSAQAWLAHADQILSAHPVQEVTLTTMPELKSVNRPDSFDAEVGFPGRSRIVASPTEAMAQISEWGQHRLLQHTVLQLLQAEWPRIRKWNLPPEPRLIATWRGRTVLQGQPPPMNSGDRILADMIAWRMATFGDAPTAPAEESSGTSSASDRT